MAEQIPVILDAGQLKELPPGDTIASTMLDATLAAIAGLAIAANTLIIGTGVDTFAIEPFAANTFAARASTGTLAPKPITDFGLSWVKGDLNSTEYLASYASLAAAITAIGSTPTVLKVTSLVTVAGTETPHANTIFQFEGDGGLTGSLGTVELKGIIDPGAHQIFFGSTNFRVGKNANGGQVRLEWWAGASNSGDCSTAFSAALASLNDTYGNGGVMLIGAGTWSITNQALSSVYSSLTIQGAGSGDSLANSTTVLALFNTAANNYVLKTQHSMRSIKIKDLTIDTGSATGCSGFIAEVNSGTTSFGLEISNVTFHGLGSGSPAQFYIKDMDAGQGEAINVHLDHCMFITPVNGKSWRNDTTNSTVLVTQSSAVCGQGSTYYYGYYSGWTTFINCDYRGANGATTYAAAYRTITSNLSTTSGSNVITATGGNAFTTNDVGQRLLVPGVIDSPITGLLTATTATTVANASSSGSGQTGSFHQFVPYSGAASTVFHFVNSRNPINIIGGADEGFQNFIVNDGSDLIGVVTVSGCTVQSRVVMNQAIPIVFNSVRISSGTFTDAASITARVKLDGCSTSKTTLYGVPLTKPNPWTYRSGNSIIQTQLGFDEDQYQQIFGMPIFVRDGNNSPTVHSLATFASSKNTASSTHQPLIRFGRLDPVTEQLDFYYDIARNYDTGHAQFTGNQELFYRGYDFDAVLKAVTYVGGVETPAAFTTHQHNWTPPTSAKYYRISADSPINMTGLGEYKTQVFGEEHEFWNIGSIDITIKHFDSGSAQFNRFRTDTGYDIILRPNEILKLVYDSTDDVSKQGWRVYKSNSSSLSDGDKGDITVSSGGTVWTIDSSVVTFAKMQAVSPNVLLGNDATGTTVEEIVCTATARSILDDTSTGAVLTTLGGTTIGQAVFVSANPSAITFGRANADNTFSWLSASDFRTAIGAGTGSGTVTGVTASSPLTSSGGAAPNISLGTVAIGNGGTNASAFGTTNGLVYYNGTSLVNDADATFDGTQMRLADTNTTQSQFRVGGFEVQNYALNNLFFADNMYYDGSNFKYRSTGYAEMLRFLNGEISFYTAASGTAGNVPTLTAQLRIDNTGIGFFTAAPVAKPTVTGSRGGNAALADLLTDLATLGLITDSTTA